MNFNKFITGLLCWLGSLSLDSDCEEELQTSDVPQLETCIQCCANNVYYTQGMSHYNDSILSTLSCHVWYFAACNYDNEWRNEWIPLFKCQTKTAVEEPRNGDTRN